MHPAPFLKQLEDAAGAVRLHSIHTYRWLGSAGPTLPRALRTVLPSETLRRILLFNLQSRLYSSFYCTGYPAAQQEPQRWLPVYGDPAFVERLSAANAGSGCWDHNCEVLDVGPREVVVSRDGLKMRVPAAEYRLAKKGDAQFGSRVSVRRSKELIGVSPGFYVAIGDRSISGEGEGQSIRLYLSLGPDRAVWFVDQITRTLNPHMPFRLKVVNHPNRFDRRDAVVLYVRKQDYADVGQLIEGLYARLALGPRAQVPALTKSVLPGVGLAEDPLDGESYGFHRCGLLADGLIRGHERGARTGSDRVRAIVERFDEAGLRADTPFLNPGSEDDYRELRAGVSARRRSGDAPAGERFADAARQIGERLVRDAFWYDDSCGWLGTDQAATSGSRSSELSHKAIGPELYEGTSGVAIFLAELYRATGERTFRDTALGAIRQALAQVERVRVVSGLGLFTGVTGIAFAVARVAAVLKDASLKRRVTAVLEQVSMRYSEAGDVQYDLLSGTAGIIAGIIALQQSAAAAGQTTQYHVFRHLAVDAADALVEAAEQTGECFSWRAPSIRRNLTGFSHGTAGIGFALLELFRMTALPRFARAAEAAFRYERRWFDASVGNWPDFRAPKDRGGRTACSTSWCHGAPGIALSRLRASEVLDDEGYRTEGLAALNSTRLALEAARDTGIGNFSLCHGMMGNAEVLMYGSQILGEDRVRGNRLARTIGQIGIRRHVEAGEPWVCGAGAGETPGLMLGLAGIGHFYLRLSDPTIPSVLIPLADDFR